MPGFTALSGQELKKFLLAKIEEEMDRSSSFANHLSHPWVKYEFSLGLATYPTQAKEDNPKKVIDIGETLESEGADTSVDGTVDTLKGDGVVDTPDLARVQTSQPIPTQVKGPGDVLVDKPVMPKLPEKKGK